MAIGILRLLKRVTQVLQEEISDHAKRGFYAAGSASEGYSGGYRDALFDVESILRGNQPSTRPEYWERAARIEKSRFL